MEIVGIEENRRARTFSRRQGRALVCRCRGRRERFIRIANRLGQVSANAAHIFRENAPHVRRQIA